MDVAKDRPMWKVYQFDYRHSLADFLKSDTKVAKLFCEKGGKGMDNLSERIIKYRARHRLSQKEMAKLCGISTQTLCYVETGQQTPGKMTIAKIMLVLEGEGNDAGK